jgi:hypothetical protein
MTYGLEVWSNSYHSNTVFKLQNRIIRIMVGIRDKESCREYFRKLKILPLQCLYTYIYIYIYIYIYMNSDIHNINTRNNLDLNYPQSHLSIYQKGAHYTGIKILNRLLFQYSNCPMTQNNLNGSDRFSASLFLLLVGCIFQIQYIHNFKVVYITCISWCNRIFATV